jgi:hypothetical protein
MHPEVAGWNVDEDSFLRGWPREAASAGWTGLEPVWAFTTVNSYELLLLAYLIGEGLCRLGQYLVLVGIWGR